MDEIEIGKEEALAGFLLAMGLVWVFTYLQQGSYNTFWAGAAGMRMLPLLVAAMLTDVLL